MSLQSDRILLPDRLKSLAIDPKWAQFEPILCVGGLWGYNNIIDNYIGAAVSTEPSLSFGPAGRCLVGGTANQGLTWNRDAYHVGSDFTIFIVANFPNGFTTGNTFIANGRTSGTNKPFNYRLQLTGSSGNVRFVHDIGGAAVEEAHTYSLGTNMSSSGPSTVSTAVSGTTLHKCIDGDYGTHTLTNAPVNNDEGSARLFMSEGPSASLDGEIYLALLFRKFIHNELLFELHANPMKFFKSRVITTGKAAAAPPAGGQPQLVNGGLVNTGLINTGLVA